MKSYTKILSQNPLAHHAYGIESVDPLLKDISSLFNSKDYSYVFSRAYDSFLIEDARAIRSFQSQKTEKPTLFIIQFTTINSISQNGLLKIIEEPTANTNFILIFPERKKLLDTLISRLEIISYKNDESLVKSLIDANIFITKNLFERYEYIKSLVDKKDTDGISKLELIKFINELELYVKNGKLSKKILPDILNARDYVESNGASIKMILDQLAISIEISQ
jgi:hypothetical protein